MSVIVYSGVEWRQTDLKWAGCHQSHTSPTWTPLTTLFIQVNYTTGSPLFTLSAWLLMEGASKWEVIRWDLCVAVPPPLPSPQWVSEIGGHRSDWHHHKAQDQSLITVYCQLSRPSLQCGHSNTNKQADTETSWGSMIIPKIIFPHLRK